MSTHIFYQNESIYIPKIILARFSFKKYSKIELNIDHRRHSNKLIRQIFEHFEGFFLLKIKIIKCAHTKKSFIKNMSMNCYFEIY